MAGIFVIVEHRRGDVREISLEMLGKAFALCPATDCGRTAVVLKGPEPLDLEPVRRAADRVIVVEDAALAAFDAGRFSHVLAPLVEEHKPRLVLMGHTAWGMDLAGALAVKTGLSLATDAVDLEIQDGRPRVVRQLYGGKIFSRVTFPDAETYLVTVRPGAFPVEGPGTRDGVVEPVAVPTDLPEARRTFVEFVDSGAGQVDISQAELLISIGRGIGEEDNLGRAQELADKLGGVLACSRPVVDKNWLPKYHQVGTSGKTVKPKVYLALGISGAFQHVAGITGGTVIAVNRDRNAPIFRVAHYGVVEDLFKIIDALKEKAAGS